MEQKRNIFINLTNQYAPWDKTMLTGTYSLWMRGYAFIDEQYYSGEVLVRYVSDCLDEVPPEAHISILKDLIPQLNGGWALVYETDGVVLAAVDRLRSIPLFYAMENGKVFLSDDAREVLKCLNNTELDDICAAEFLVTGYVTGKDTLYKGLYQIQSGEILEVKISKDASTQISTHRYYRFIFGNYFEADEQELEEELSKLWHRIFSRYAIALKGKTPVIPLSGGVDSRLIAAMLKKCGVENAICFSLGRRGNVEAETSQAVANALGYKWLFCPYDYPSWYKWSREEQMLEYTDYASNKSSLALIYDWPAVRQIVNDILEDEIVFMPGHTGDFLTGGHIPSNLFEEKEIISYDTLVTEAVLSKHYLLWHNVSSDIKDLFVARIRKLLPPFSTGDKLEAIGAYETWEFESRQARYIINGVRVHEFFGCQWMLPWWDYELMDFFLRVKADFRFQRRLYRSTLIRKIFIDELSELAKIPTVESILLQESNNKEAKHSRNFFYRILKGVLLNVVKDYFRYYLREDRVFARYGIYIGEKSLLKLLKNVESCLPTSSNMPPTVKRILQLNKRKPIMTCHILGLGSASYIGLLANVSKNMP